MEQRTQGQYEKGYAEGVQAVIDEIYSHDLPHELLLRLVEIRDEAERLAAEAAPPPLS
jgi:hypothetical protein